MNSIKVSDNSNNYSIVDEAYLVNSNLTNWAGWLCSIGQINIDIRENGNVLGGNCPQRLKYGNLYVMVTYSLGGEYRMRINGVDYKTENKSYKRVSTVMDKVKTHYEIKNREKIEDRLIEEFVVNLIENPPYKDSVVKRKVVYQGGYSGNSYNKFMYSHVGVEITLQNGIKIECRVFVSRNEAMLSRHSIVLPDKLGSTTMDVLECLNKVEFQVNKEEEK